jgi:hypothetical protein
VDPAAGECSPPGPGLLDFHPDVVARWNEDPWSVLRPPEDSITFMLSGIFPNTLALMGLGGWGREGIRDVVGGLGPGALRDMISKTVFDAPIMARPIPDVVVSGLGGYATTYGVNVIAGVVNKVVNQIPAPSFLPPKADGTWFNAKISVPGALATLYLAANIEYKLLVPAMQAKRIDMEIPFSGGYRIRTERNPINVWPSPVGEDAEGKPIWASDWDYNFNAFGNAGILGGDMWALVHWVLKKNGVPTKKTVLLSAITGLGVFGQKLYTNWKSNPPQPTNPVYPVYRGTMDTFDAIGAGIDRSWANPRPEVLQDNVVAAAANGIWSVVGDKILYAGERANWGFLLDPGEFLDDWNRGWNASAPPGGRRGPIAPIGRSWADTRAAFDAAWRNLPEETQADPVLAAGLALRDMEGEGPGWGAMLSDLGWLTFTDYYPSVGAGLETLIFQDTESEWAAATASAEAAGERAHEFWRRALETEGVTDLEELRQRAALNTLDAGAAIVPALWENFKRGIQAPLGLEYSTEQADRIGADVGNLRDAAYALWLDSLTPLDRQLLGLPPKTP